MPNMPLVHVNKSLLLVVASLEVVQLALNNNPTPAQRLQLLETEADLQTIKDELEARRTQIENGDTSFPAPGPGVIAAISALLLQVNAAKLEGVAANARLTVARQALALVLSTMPAPAGA